jgi:hopene-associated glycosyltransferase HpnB
VATFWLAACVPGALLWLIVLVLPWRPWSTRERLEGEDGGRPPEAGQFTILIPARNESGQIGRTLAGIREQVPEARVIVVDDGSTDGTAGTAHQADLPNLRVIEARPIAPGWTGKLWALDQGLAAVETELTLLLDADIELGPGLIAALLEHRRKHGFKMVSLMATLETGGFWEKLLLPAFVYFFKLLYPFHLSNSGFRRVAAGAGGCVLVETEILREVGAFSSIRDELIDDCALAARIKTAGHRIWTGLSRGVTSHRRHGGLKPIWDMVARTAYTQLRYSSLLLLACGAMLSWAFWWPVVGLAIGTPAARVASSMALIAMTLTYLPTLRFYRLSPLWALLLPFTGTFYLAMTVDSALRYRRGVRSAWRGRVYSANQHKPQRHGDTEYGTE